MPAFADRIFYLRQYLKVAHRAVSEGYLLKRFRLEFIREERDEVTVSFPVLNTSGSGDTSA